jgi:hypothetical protein
MRYWVLPAVVVLIFASAMVWFFTNDRIACERDGGWWIGPDSALQRPPGEPDAPAMYPDGCADAQFTWNEPDP